MDYRKHISKSRLSMEEKADLRSEFLSRTGLKSAPSNYFINKAPHYVGIAALSLLLVAVGASPFAIAAENSQPGDLLYPIKATINEPIKKVVQTVVSKKTAEPATPTAEPKTENEEDASSESDIMEKKNEKRRGTKKNEAGSPAVTPASVIHATDSQVKKIVDTATRKVTDVKIIDEAAKVVPVEIIALPKDESKTKKKDAKKQKADTDESANESVTDTVEKTADKAIEAVNDATDAVSDTVDKTTKIIDISL